MIKSMTAFANSEKNLGLENGELLISWEIRSVNHRYLDASIYLPESFTNLETSLKDLLRKKLGRGKVDAKLVIKSNREASNSNLKVNESLVKNLIETQKTIEAIAKNISTEKVAALSTNEILNYPSVLESTEVDYAQYTKEVISLFKNALSGLISSREEEGARLKEMLLVRAENIKDIVVHVKQRRPIVIEALREKVIKKISDLDFEADNNRLEQELVIQAQRLDVDEELDRLDSHIEELLSVLERKEPIGRRLDFLMQELNREANTLGSKANDAETTKSSVELKVLIEQMREQVMNLE